MKHDRPGLLARAGGVLLGFSICFGVATFALSAENPKPPFKSPPKSPEALTKTEEGQVYDQAVHILGGNANVIARWVGEVRATIIGDTSHDAAAIAGATLQEVTDQIGLPLVPLEYGFDDAEAYLEAVMSTPPGNLSVCQTASADPLPICANFVVVIASQQTMEGLAKAIPLRKVYQQAFAKSSDVKCFFAPSFNGSMVIARALVYLRNDLDAAMQRTCLREEIYQSFGLFNDYTESAFYSFNNVVEPKEITEYDRALLQSVYDPDFAPGSPVFSIMKRFIEDLGIDPFSN